jgi:histidine triad (HIT) family protein
MTDSIFTKIIRGEIPSHKIYEDAKTFAFLNIHPAQPGHILVVPKTQVNHIWDLSDEDYQALWAAARKIAKHILPLSGAARIGVMVVGFGVPHAHIHLVPINDASELREVPEDDEPDHAALAKMAEKLRLTD